MTKSYFDVHLPIASSAVSLAAGGAVPPAAPTIESFTAGVTSRLSCPELFALIGSLETLAVTATGGPLIQGYELTLATLRTARPSP